ncbi:MAG TPA: hypothetical protein VMI75_06350, partial [Polyangiaceae bacterium]|nr:hypothetical protein [Polyangiaceae bacterium]
MGRQESAAAVAHDTQWNQEQEDEPPTLRLVDPDPPPPTKRNGLPEVRMGRFGDEWIGPRIALDARVALLRDTVGEIEDQRVAWRFVRLVRELRDVQAAIDAIVEEADASPEIAGRLGAAVAHYVDSVYAWCACVGAAIDEWAAQGGSTEGAALTSQRFRQDLVHVYELLESACTEHGSRVATRVAMLASRLQAEIAQL